MTTPDPATLAAKAEKLLALHVPGQPVVLPTVWDAWSAQAVAEAGFAALTVGSHPLADSRGQDDAESMSLSDALDGIARVTQAVDLPVSADVESGYGVTPSELVERVLVAGRWVSILKTPCIRLDGSGIPRSMQTTLPGCGRALMKPGCTW